MNFQILVEKVNKRIIIAAKEANRADLEPDTTVIIIESMKMELEIKAGAAGKVHFTVPTGTQVSNGQTVAEIQ